MKPVKLFTTILLVACVSVTGCSFLNGGKSGGAETKIPTYQGWTTVNLKDIGTMQIPPTMEVQTSEYLKQLEASVQNDPDKLVKVQKENAMGLSFNAVICQTKGINASGKEPGKDLKFAKVVFSIIPVQTKVPSYGKPIGLNEAQIKEFGDITKESIMKNNEFLGTNLKFLKWEPMKSEIINGAECLHIAYERQLGNEPSVLIDRYIFFDKDRLFTFETAYRSTEKEYWHGKEQDIGNIVNTINLGAKPAQK